MKKLFFIAAILAVVASYGGNAILAHAQTMSPAETAQLQQELAAAKATLVNLEMQAGMTPGGDANLTGSAAPTTMAPTTVTPTTESAMPTVTITPTSPNSPEMTITVTPTMTESTTPAMVGTAATAPTTNGAMAISPADAAAMSSALQTLSVALVDLQTELTNDPNLAQTNGPTILATLQGIGNSVASIGSSIMAGGSNIAANTGSANGQPLALSPTAPVTVSPTTPPTTQPNVTAPTTQPSLSVTQPQPAPAAPTDNSGATAGTGNTAPSTVTPVPATAQTSSAFSGLNWPFIAIVVLIIAAIAIWLFWGGDDDADTGTKKTPTKPTTSPAQRPVIVQSNQQNVNRDMPSVTARPATPAQTPLSNAVATPNAQSSNVILPNSQSSMDKRKPA